MRLPKKPLFFIPVIGGILLMAFMVNNKKDPNRPELTEQARHVSVVDVEETPIVPRITGYGYVQPAETWEAIPEVSGRIIDMHPELKQGSFISKGEVLLKIDPQTYGLAESRGVASVMSIEARLVELEQQRTNTERLLEIEKKSLRLARQELERKKDLYSKGYVSASELELEEKNVLSQESGVNSLVNTLKLIPAQKKNLLAEKESGVSSLSERRLDIEKTIIKAPFDCRIAAVNIEQDQFAPAGSKLLEAISISSVEIPVQIPLSSFASLLSGVPEEMESLFETSLDMNRIREAVGLTAKVRIALFNKTVEWDAKFLRTGESIDLPTGTVPVYVGVDDPYRQVVPGKRPPLVPNMYTEVLLSGKPRDGRYIIPFKAIHEGIVYTVDDDSRLVRKKVEVEMVVDNMAIVKGGLEGQVTVVTTDLIPAVEGMLLSPRVDEEMREQILAVQAAN